MAGDPVACLYLPPFGHDMIARLKGKRASGMEAATAGRSDRARHVAADDSMFALPLLAGIGHRHGQQKRVGIRVQGVVK